MSLSDQTKVILYYLNVTFWVCLSVQPPALLTAQPQYIGVPSYTYHHMNYFNSSPSHLCVLSVITLLVSVDAAVVGLLALFCLLESVFQMFEV